MPQRNGRVAVRGASKIAWKAGAKSVAEPRAAVSYASGLEERLRDKAYAAAYVQAAADEGCEAFVVAIGDVVRANRFSNVSEKTALNREHLYRAFSKNGNPSIETVWSVMDAIGLHLSGVVKKSKSARHRAPSRVSLDDIPEIEFSKPKVRKNPYAKKVVEQGLTIQVGQRRPKELLKPVV
jgi:probable addiction module antidote protein